MEIKGFVQLPNVTTFSGDEYLKIMEVVTAFSDRGISEELPKFVIFMGGVGSGKTTLRRANYATGYVHFDFSEIYLAIKKAMAADSSRLAEYCSFAATLLLQGTLEARKNIVIEIIGESLPMIAPVIDAMKGIGYDISLQGVFVDIAEGYRRHLQAIAEDPEYMTAAYSQEATLSTFFAYFNLGEMPHAEEESNASNSE